MVELPNTLLAIRYKENAILVDFPSHEYATLIGRKLYRIPYHGNAIDIAIVPWGLIADNPKQIVKVLGGRATLALLP